MWLFLAGLYVFDMQIYHVGQRNLPTMDPAHHVPTCWCQNMPLSQLGHRRLATCTTKTPAIRTMPRDSSKRKAACCVPQQPPNPPRRPHAPPVPTFPKSRQNAQLLITMLTSALYASARGRGNAAEQGRPAAVFASTGMAGGRAALTNGGKCLTGRKPWLELI